MKKVIVIIATAGRPKIVDQTLCLLRLQSRKPDRVIVVGASAGDVCGLKTQPYDLHVLTGERGLCAQRNLGLHAAGNDADIICFIDDDYLPSFDYIERIENIFQSNSKVVGITGYLIADGAHESGLEFKKGLDYLLSHVAATETSVRNQKALYGCNMSYRRSAIEGLKFDEKLPLYGWLEDIDFSRQAGERGTLISSTDVSGVHLGHKSGRTSGKKLGYSQVVNVYYLSKKGTMQPGLGRKLIFQNLSSNLVKSIRPESWIDRRGRLYGNFLGIIDILLGKADPMKILRM